MNNSKTKIEYCDGCKTALRVPQVPAVYTCPKCGNSVATCNLCNKNNCEDSSCFVKSTILERA